MSYITYTQNKTPEITESIITFAAVSQNIYNMLRGRAKLFNPAWKKV